MTKAELDWLSSLTPEQKAKFAAAPAAEQLRLLDQVRSVTTGDYRRDPVGYFRNVLKVTPTPDQEMIARSCLEPPYRVKVDAAHATGKTALASWLVNWFFDAFPTGISITTATTEQQVKDVLWAQIRQHRMKAGLDMKFMAPAEPRMEENVMHWAKGYTARVADAFQGRHYDRMLFIFDESEGIEPEFWTVTKTMFRPDGEDIWLAIGNPTTTTSQSYAETMAVDIDGNPTWRHFSMSALNHPNILAELKGDPKPVRDAVTLKQVDGMVADFFDPVPMDEKVETDIEWRPGTGRWWRPGPDGESRVLGRRPTSGTDAIWSEAIWEAAVRANLSYFPNDQLPEIGIDVARSGKCWTVFHVRWGAVSLHHERHNGWSTTKTAARAKELCDEWSARANYERGSPTAKPVTPNQIAIKVDDDGVGGGVTDILRTWQFFVVPIHANTPSTKPGRYPNRRSELWFHSPDLAKTKGMDLHRLPKADLQRLRIQCLAPIYEVDNQGRRKVEKKEDMIERLGYSPDDADSLNLAYLSWPNPFAHLHDLEEPPRKTMEERMLEAHQQYNSNQERRGLYGLAGRRGQGTWGRADERGLYGRGR